MNPDQYRTYMVLDPFLMDPDSLLGLGWNEYGSEKQSRVFVRLLILLLLILNCRIYYFLREPKVILTLIVF